MAKPATIDIMKTGVMAQAIALKAEKDKDPVAFNLKVEAAQKVRADKAEAVEAAKAKMIVDHSYPYYQFINPPSSLGMSDKGTLTALSNNIDGLMDYVKVLTEGTGKASVTGKPLGNKYFMDTSTKCTVSSLDGTPVSPAAEEERFIYINNVPTGDFGLVSMPGSRGLIPGVMSSMSALNPAAIMKAITAGAKPNCAQVTLQTIDEANNMSAETHYVALTDIPNIDACSFWTDDKKNPSGINPMTKDKCTEKFETMSMSGEPKLPNDMVTQVYFASLAGLGLYIIYRFMQKN